MKDKIISYVKTMYILLIKSMNKRKISHKNNKIIFLLSFPSTSEYILESLYTEFGDKLVICYTKNAKKIAINYQKKGCTVYPINNLYVLSKKIVPSIQFSRIIFCDNYFAFLAGIEFDSQTEVVQLWHANGAIKKFGVEANYTKDVSELNKQRYPDVYQKFTKYVVSSNKMKEIFSRNYQQSIDELPFGYSLTDLYFNKLWMQNSKKRFQKLFPNTSKVLLYVPTYRETDIEIPISFRQLKEESQDNWTIFVNPHPHDRTLKIKLNDNTDVISNFKGMSLQELLPNVDCLITDYSSVPFEYSLANPNGKIIFYCYDFEYYQQSVGLEEDFELWAPGKIVKTQNELINEINSEAVYASLNEFNHLWNEYAKGSSQKQLIEWVKQKNDS